MREGEFFTWSRAVNIAVVEGRIPSEEMRQRTLGLTYTDRVRDFDHIEWTLDNRDGRLTQPEYIAAGFIVRLQLGYADSTFPWKAFIINRVRGGLGVAERNWCGVGSQEAQVTYYGRNRNAAGGRASRSWRQTAQPPPKKPPKQYPATTDITSQEMVLGTLGRPRLIKARTTAEAVEEVARRNGFTDSYALIEETYDALDGGAVTIPPGMSDGQWLQERAARFEHIFKIDQDGLHWHSPHWAGAKHEVVDELIYGGTPDILQLTVDCDFTLPVPSQVTAKGYSFHRRAMVTGDSDYDQITNKVNLGIAYGDMLDDAQRSAALMRHETFPAVLDSDLKATQRLSQRFVARHIRAFKVNVETVGNPKLLAGKLVRIGGTGSPFLANPLYIAEAQHIITANEYRTRLNLTHPPRGAGGRGPTTMGIVQDPKYDRDVTNKVAMGGIYFRGWSVRDAPKGLRR